MESRDPRFDVLFEPVKLGPVTAPNRFYQVPHCTGMGYVLPEVLAAMRGVKAEGGWGVVNTEYCSIHATSDDMPNPYAALWDDGDVRNMAKMTQAVHAYGALAGVELWHGGMRASNQLTRAVSLGPESLPTYVAPWQCQKMDKEDIKALRQWHRAAALRARQAGFDVVYVYAAHTYLVAQFLDPVINQRSDEYGGSAENRARLYRELIDETREAIGADCAIATRVEVTHEDGTGREERNALIASIAPLIDLFDVTIPDYSHEMGASRFIRETSLEGDIAHVRALTGKPVVSVGRFTSPETMLSQVRRGMVDLVGVARPSIADPFMPAKIRAGRLDDIRECIGCNVCYAQNSVGVPIRCTQNPTMGEEWRRGWHPERVSVSKARDTVLVVGGGPAGLEAALTLGRRGVPVMLAEARNELGGRINGEARLPGLTEWARVRDWRLHQLGKLEAVAVFKGSSMTADDCVATGARHVIAATGSSWRRDGRGLSFPNGVTTFDDVRTFSPDQIMAGLRSAGPVVIFDDENYYMAASLAELLVREGRDVTYVSSKGCVGEWMKHTVEQARMQSLLVSLGVRIIVNSRVTALVEGGAVLAGNYGETPVAIACGCFVPVTSREPNDHLFQTLRTAGFASITRIGDCKAPGIIAQAVFDGHRAAEEFGGEAVSILRDRPLVA